MAFRVNFGGSKYLVSYDTGLFLPIANTGEENVYALGADEVQIATQSSLNNIQLVCAKIRKSLLDHVLDTTLPIAGISDVLPIRELVPITKRHEKAWRSFESLPPA